jgi:RNA polymerase sigma-70 factor (ECF subfamily)
MFYELVRRYERPLYGFFVRHMRDPVRAEDLFQDTFMIVHRNRTQHSGEGKFRSWLYTIALNLLRSRQRKAKREKSLSDMRPPDSPDLAESLANGRTPEPADSAALSEEAEKVRAAVNELPEEHRDIVIFRVYQQLSFEEIARITGDAIGTLKSRMFYALQKLRPKLMQIARAGGYLK